jgi:hypothetical protein
MKKKFVYIYERVTETCYYQCFQEVTDLERDGNILSFTDVYGERHVTNGRWEIVTIL